MSIKKGKSSGKTIPGWNPGDVVDGTYQILEKIGKGGFGDVYLARHPGWNVDLAIKRPNKPLDPVLEKRLRREAEAWMELGLHPNIASCYFVKNIDGYPNLFAEYVRGGTLHGWLYPGRNFATASTAELGAHVPEPNSAPPAQGHSFADKLRMAIEICRGMHHAHTFEWTDESGHPRHGMIHRDLKPANILLEEDGTPRIADFGMVGYGPKIVIDVEDKNDTIQALSTRAASDLSTEAKSNIGPTGLTVSDPLADAQFLRLPGETSQVSMPGGICGTPAYMSPEHFLGIEKTEKVSDIYSFGVILYEIFFGRWPFIWPPHPSLKRQNRFDYFKRMHCDEEPPHPGAIHSDVDCHVERLIFECLEKRVDTRPKDFASIRDRLKAVFGEAQYDDLYPEPNPAELLADSLNNRAVSYLELDKKDRAETLWQKALEHDSHHVEATYNLCIHFWRSSQITDQELVRRMEEVKATHASHWRPAYLLGLIHLERNDREAAIDVLEKAAVTSEQDEDVLAALERARALGESHVRTFEGHNSLVTSVCLSADARWALSGGDDDTLRLWDVRKGACRSTFKGHTGKVHSVCLSADARWALSGGDDDTLRLWDVRKGACRSTFKGHTGKVHSVCLSADAQWALSGSEDKTVQLWHVETGACRRVFEGHTRSVYSVCLSADAQWALSGGDDHTLRLWHVETGACRRVFEGHTRSVYSVCLSADVRWALSGSSDCTLRLWDVETGTCLRTFEGHTNSVNSVCLSEDARWAVSGSYDKTLRLWRLSPSALKTAALAICRVSSWKKSNELRKQLDKLLVQARESTNVGDWREALDSIRAIQALPGHARHAEAFTLRSRVGSRCVRRGFRSGWHVHAFEGHSDDVSSVCLSADARWALSGSYASHSVRLWDIKSGACLRTFGEQYKQNAMYVTSVCLSADARWALSGGGDQTLRLWDVETGACLRAFEERKCFVRTVCLSADARWALSGGEGIFGDKNELRLWDVRTGACLRTFEGSGNMLLSVCLSADARCALSSSSRSGNTVQLWDVRTGERLRAFVGHTDIVYSVCLSADSRWALSGSRDHTLRLWDVETGTCLRAFEGHTNQVNSVCLSADARWALSGGDDDTLRLWDVETGACLRTFRGHEGPVGCVCLSADARWALSGSNDANRSRANTLRLWELEWEYDVPDPADWDEGARPYLQNFLTLRTPYECELPAEGSPSEEDVIRALTRAGHPSWTDEDFKQLLHTLGCAGYGWLRPEGVRRELEKMATKWDGPPTAPWEV